MADERSISGQPITRAGQDADRAISGAAQPQERRVDHALRPQSLDEMIGQDRLRAKIKILVQAARQRDEALDHVLLYGPPGLGKTTLSHILATEMGANLKVTAGPAIEKAGDLAAILTNLRKGDVLFIDEIHRLGRAVEEILYPAMEDFTLNIVVGSGPAARNIQLKLPKFTVVGATTRLALITSPLRARFGVVERFDYYEPAALTEIVTRAARLLDVPIEPDAAAEIARRARGTPRVALRLLRRVRDYAQVRARGHITLVVAQQALALQEIDELGLDDLDRRVLGAISSTSSAAAPLVWTRWPPASARRRRHGCGGAMRSNWASWTAHRGAAWPPAPPYAHLHVEYPDRRPQASFFSGG
ncbi:MAG: Holliday junction branch migration DNA helicase RuvB [Caldilineaceae bacterium]